MCSSLRFMHKLIDSIFQKLRQHYWRCLIWPFFMSFSCSLFLSITKVCDQGRDEHNISFMNPKPNYDDQRKSLVSNSSLHFWALKKRQNFFQVRLRPPMLWYVKTIICHFHSHSSGNLKFKFFCRSFCSLNKKWKAATKKHISIFSNWFHFNI